MLPNGVYHYFNRANNQEELFPDELNYVYFLGLMKVHLLPVCDFYSYCLLRDHFHFVLRIKESDMLPKEISEGRRSIAQPFSNLFNAYTKALNRRLGRRGSLFQEHPKRMVIESNEHLRKVVLYVNANPSHHGLGDYESYAHSSYGALISEGNTAILRDEVHRLFGGKQGFINQMASRSEALYDRRNASFEWEDE